MSHFTVLIIGEDPEKQLQPFHEYECTGIKDEHVIFVQDDEYDPDPITGIRGHWTNPNRKWDWYSLGGRWAGFFKLKPYREGIQGHHRAKDFATISGKVVEDLPLSVADQCYKKDIDFETMRNEAGKEAQDKYEFAMTFLSDLPKQITWDAMIKIHKDIKDARFEYWEQPRCIAWKEAEKNTDRDVWPFGWGSSPDEFIMSKEDYIENARDGAISTHAVIKDGKWYERGRMGWWAVVSDVKDNWNREFANLLDSVPNDTILSVYDCHI